MKKSLPLADLTARQHEVLSLIACGYSDAAIGKELRISGLTVSVHVRRLLARLGVAARHQAACELMRGLGAAWLESFPDLLTWRDADRVRLLERCLLLETEVVQLRAIVAASTAEK